MFDISYPEIIDDLLIHENAEKREVAEKYVKRYGYRENRDYFDQVWYQDYLAKFNVPSDFEINLPSDFNFDTTLLLRLAAGSFSSFVDFEVDNENGVEFVIYVENSGNIIGKKISELFLYQIDRLFRIYVEEQMNLQNHMDDDENKPEEEHEKPQILEQRTLQFHKWNQLLDIIALKQAGLELM